MIFRHVGPVVSHHWKLVLACWGLAFLLCTCTAPAWRDVVRDGEFSFLPKSAPSQVAEAVYRQSFSRDLLGSTAVIVVRRAGRAEGLLPQDRQFIEDVLKPAIKRIAGKAPGPEGSIIRAVRTADDRLIGQLLTSADGKTTLVLVELTTGFLDSGNWPTLSEIETLIAQEGELVGRPDNLFAKKLIPPGLDLSLSGPAAVGRDLRRNAEHSTLAVVQWSLLVVVAGLVLFYRAPLLALVPLITSLAAVGMTMAVLTHLAAAGWLGVFAGMDNYLIVVLVGLGLVSSLLIISRENESRFQTPTLEDAAAESLRLAGPALAGGMLLAVLGLGMLIFAQYGKFQELGAAFLIGAGFVLLGATTLAPALLVLMGRWAFWPNMRAERISAESAWCLPRGPWSLSIERSWSQQVWQSLGRSLSERPRTIGVTCLVAMLPFIVVAGLCHSRLTYGMLSQLPEDKPSVKGAQIIQQQFAAGTTGPVMLLLEHPQWKFGTADGKAVVAKLSDRLEDRKGEFDIADIRSVAFPLGLSEKDAGTKTFLQRTLRHRKAVEYYVGDKAPVADHATKLEIVFAQNPFARESIDNFERLRSKLPALLPAELAGVKLHLMGAPRASAI